MPMRPWGKRQPVTTSSYPPSIPLEPSVCLFVKGATVAKASWIPTGILLDCCLLLRLPALIV